MVHDRKVTTYTMRGVADGRSAAPIGWRCVLVKYAWGDLQEVSKLRTLHANLAVAVLF